MPENYNLDNLLNKHESYLRILQTVSKHQHEAQVRIKKLEDQRSRLKKSEKNYSTLLFKNLRSERKEFSQDTTPFGKNNSNRRKRNNEIWKLPLSIHVEVLSEEYTMPLKQRFPDLDVNVHMNSVEDIHSLDPSSMYFTQMEDLINSPRRSIPKLQEEIVWNRIEDQRKREAEEEERKKQERMNQIKMKMRASKKVALLTSLMNQAKKQAQIEAEKKAENEVVNKTLRDLWSHDIFRKHFEETKARKEAERTRVVPHSTSGNVSPKPVPPLKFSGIQRKYGQLSPTSTASSPSETKRGSPSTLSKSRETSARSNHSTPTRLRSHSIFERKSDSPITTGRKRGGSLVASPISSSRTK